MKKIISILLSAAIFTACNSNKVKEQPASADTVVEKQHEHEEKTAALELNNGAKWKIDTTTSVNVGLLKAIASQSKATTPADYTETATKLENGLNKLVQECKMSGADHDALHHWLEPIIEKTRELKNAAATVSAGEILSEIEKQLNLFDQYFEL